ncbi:MAG TPA: helix-turn-helix transcriptional regulator [Pseudonocardiaceae bacterium]|jgi:transcriptional regulator with XRE-family HTH domain|nr:helix-turn-helix transcriptional regulator [Pseudonocardiaceae bacterium]
MDGQARAIGQRVRYWRIRRNLNRRQFADMVGRSTSWVDKIETGERTLLRLPMLERVAGALGIDPSALTDSSAAARAADCVDAAEVAAIRAALGRYPSLSAPALDQRHPTLAHVAGQMAYVEHAWSSSHFTVVSQYLPRLLDDAQAVALTASVADQVAAHRVLVVAYRLASSVLLKFGAHDIAWLAADRAMQAAVAVDDTLALARATRSVARAMSSSGQGDGAIAAVIGMVDRMRSELPGREHQLLAPYGMLFLAAAVTAARNDDAALALAMHQEAEAAADLMVPGHETHQTSFGRANVAVHRVAVLVRLHEGGRALDYAHGIDSGLIASLPPERRANCLLDLTQALTDTGRHPDAVRTLCEAERVAPEEVRCRPLARRLVRSLLDTTSGDAGRLVRQMARRAGLTA